MQGTLKLLVGAALVVSASMASAAIISLDFEKVASYPNGNNVFIQEFYNGGTASNGFTGTNYGISFGNNALLICLNSTTVSCSNTSRGGLAPASAEGSLFFLDGAETFMNVAAGFSTGFSFNYVSSVTGSVGVYDGLNGTGNLLATVKLEANLAGCSAYNAGFCPFGPAGVTFAGIAKSVSFAGVANQIVFDDITFGTDIPGPPAVPEPATWAMLILGFGAVGVAARRRRSSRVALNLA